jgi:hypothetical protein
MDVYFKRNITNNFTFYFQPNLQIKNGTTVQWWPQAKISKIDPSGLLTIRFAQKMEMPANPALIQNGMISVNETEYPILSFDLVPGKFTDPLKAKFNWTFVDF